MNDHWLLDHVGRAQNFVELLLVLEIHHDHI